MNWVRLIAVVIGAGVVTSLTDWFFAGDWIHRRFSYPEVWRKGNEERAIALTSPLPFVSCAVFALVAIDLAQGSARSNFALAVAIWLIGPLPVILTNAAFIKLHRVFVAAYASGWLVKLLVFAAALSLWPPRK
jgi:hypothetical protein